MVGTAVALGGALGAVLRFAMSGWVTTWAHAGFPWGTFVVNATGSLALGIVLVLVRGPGQGAAVRAFFAVGLCGGFTTFSTFDFELLALLRDARYGVAALYATASVSACMAGLAAGLRLTPRPESPPG